MLNPTQRRGEQQQNTTATRQRLIDTNHQRERRLSKMYIHVTIRWQQPMAKEQMPNILPPIKVHTEDNQKVET